jgi:hypothetical protein
LPFAGASSVLAEGRIQGNRRMRPGRMLVSRLFSRREMG